MKNILILPNGSEISSGPNTTNALTWVEETESVNIGEDLVIGSAYANKMKARILTPFGGLTVNAGDEVILVKEDYGVRTQCGIYVMEKPERTSAHSTQLTGYDRVVKLDKDLSQWLNSLTGWPYRLIDFAVMVCEACGLTLATTSIPNANFPVPQFFRANVTGRQLMRWIGEICCRFCRANSDGNIELAWYEPSGKTISPTGEYRYFARSLSYDTYEVQKIDAVQLRLANSTDGALWPAAANNVRNPYVISGNPILMANVTNDLVPYLKTIEQELKDFTYTPCNVAIPATMDIRAGHTVDITDINGNKIKTVVMTKTSKGLRNTLESTGNPSRESTNAVNNKSPSQKAEEAVENQTHEDIFNKLTKNGQIQGIYVQDGKWYINAELAQIVNIIANSITSGILKSKDGKTKFNLDTGEITCKTDYGTLLFSGSFLTLENTAGELRASIGMGPDGRFANVWLFDENATSYGFSMQGNDLAVKVRDMDFNRSYSHKVCWKRIGEELVLAAMPTTSE